MSVFASGSGRTLIIGIGNPLRGDDGLGWAVAEQLAQDGDMACEIRTVHQLTPELAQWVAFADRVIMIDASCEGVPGELRVYQLALSGHPVSRGTHATTPEELIILAEYLYGRCAPVTIVTMTGADFSIGERLSPTLASKICQIGEVVRQLYTNVT
ncbi:MAG TPA: hydrogenase maturation protease [Ktedonobacteraceae bacterium]|nr:hydrogenase maturation protease [Ktedonobacteraceae bacterium]